MLGACNSNTTTTNSGTGTTAEVTELEGSWIVGDTTTFAIIETYEAGKWTAEAYSQGEVIADIAADYTVTTDANGVMTISYSNFVGDGAEQASQSVTAEIKDNQLLVTEGDSTRTYTPYVAQQ